MARRRQSSHLRKSPFFSVTVITPDDYLGGILKLFEDKRGVQESFEYVAGDRAVLRYQVPLNESCATSTIG